MHFDTNLLISILAEAVQASLMQFVTSSVLSLVLQCDNKGYTGGMNEIEFFFFKNWLRLLQKSNCAIDEEFVLLIQTQHEDRIQHNLKFFKLKKNRRRNPIIFMN